MSVPSGNIKGSPFTMTGINKTLLTPCRRIGLSRKIKPIHKLFNKPLQETQSPGRLDTNLQHNKGTLNPVNNAEDCTVSPAKQLLPLRKKEGIKVVADEHHSDVTDSIKIEINNLQRNKETLNPVNNTEGSTVSRAKQLPPLRKKEAIKVVAAEHPGDVTDSVKIQKKKCHAKVVTRKKSESTEKLDHLQRMVVEDEKEKPANTYTPLEIRSDDLKELQSKELKVNMTKMDHSTKRKNASSAPPRQVKRTLSMKKSTDTSKADSSDTDDEIGMLESDDTLSNNISSEDTFVTVDDGNNSLQVAQEVDKENKLSLVREILQIEKRIRQKELNLSKFQQAELYRKMHNVEDLDKLTKSYKSTCQETLRELVEILNKRNPVNMSMLLKHLRVPSSLVNYDSEEDIFVE